MRGAVVALALISWASGAAAHDGRVHAAPPAPAAAAAAETAADLAFGRRIGGAYELVDQDGRVRRPADFAGRFTLIFFGYANCDGICSVALPRMASALDLLGAAGDRVQPLLITVDPERDTPAAMRAALPRIHPRLLGLTGSPQALSAARAAFHVDSDLAYTDPDRGAVFHHGGFIYLMGPDGRFLTLMPPILGPERMAGILRRYLAEG